MPRRRPEVEWAMTNPDRPDWADRTRPDPGGPADAATADATTQAVPDGNARAEQAQIDDAVVELARDDLDPRQRRRLFGQMLGELRARGVRDLFKPTGAMRWVADTVTDVAPRLPLRDLRALREQHPGLSDEAIADRLVRDASRMTAGIGAVGGGVAAIEWVATPTLLTTPVLLAAETAVVVAVELKLIGELHELYGSPIQGSGSQRAVSLVHSWTQRRGVNPLVPGAAMSTVLGTAARKELRDRLLRRFGRNLTTLGPFLTGAAVAGVLNRRATHKLAHEIRKDLHARRRAVGAGTWTPGEVEPHG